MRSVAPSARLAPFVREFMLVEVRDETTRVRLPEPGLVLGVRYRGSASVVTGDGATRLPPVSLAGMASTARRMRTAAGSGTALEALLVARLRPQPPDPVVAAALRAIADARGAVQIRALARRLAISQDPLEKRFRRSVGASPKQFASLLRVRHAIDAYRPGARLTQLARDAGYFDQSHFNRELRAVTGEAPGPFLRAEEYR